MRTLMRDVSRELSEAKAIELYQEGLERFATFSDDEDLKKAIQVKRIPSGNLNEAAKHTDRVGIVFEQVDLGLDEEAFHISHFLRETLYRLAHCYEIVDYVLWPAFNDSTGVDPHEPIAKLVIGGKHFALLDNSGPLLLILSD